MTLRIGLLLLAVLCQVTVGAWGWAKTTQLDSARQAATQLGQQLETIRSDVERQRSIVTRLNATLNQQRHAQAEQLKRLNELRLGLAQRMQQIETLKRENPDLRHWAAKPLPDAARRLRQRPALIGADAYRQWLSGSRALRTPTDSAAKQRQPAG